MPKMDSRKKSLCEAGSDIGIGFAINFTLNYFILPYYAIDIGKQDVFALLQIGLWFTIVALLRKYVVRRFFESLRKKKKWQIKLEKIWSLHL